MTENRSTHARAAPAKSAAFEALPDLLNSDRQPPRNMRALQKKLQFAFSSGESAGSLRSSLQKCAVSESNWRADCFASDLFVDELIEKCFRISSERFADDFCPPQHLAYFKKVVLHPPSAQSSVLFRQKILAELLAKPELRQRFELVYQNLAELRADLDSTGVLGCEYSTRRRIDLLIRIKNTVDQVAQEFADAESGIERIGEWAREFQRVKGYAALRDFVNYEGRLSSVQLQFQVGVDGSMRNLKIIELADNTASPYYQSPLARLGAWLRLWWRGSTTGRDELVVRVVAAVFDGIETPLAHVLYLIGHMEFYLGALAFVDRCAKKELATCLPSFVDKGGGRSLRGLFNPLLLGQNRPPVVCDFDITGSDTTTVITGPNSGGKTRLLQSLGMTQLLGQGGLPVPARHAELWFRSSLFVSLIQDASADQKEGRLGTELLRIRQLFEKTPPDAMIILDELCSGTNPSEGEEIILLVLSLLRELQPEAFISTHFLRFAEQLAHNHDPLGLEFRQVKLDDQQEPTYQFTPGVAQSSLAGQTARRLGVTREQLRALMKQRQDPQYNRAENKSQSALSLSVGEPENDSDDDDPPILRRGRRRLSARALLKMSSRRSIL